MSAEDLVALAVSQGGLGNDALLAAVLPLFHETAAVHERGLVAPLRGLDRIVVDEQNRLGFAPEDAGRPTLATREIDTRQGKRPSALEVVAHRQADLDLGESGGQETTVVPEPVPDAITAPTLVAGWQSWEHVVGHHDQLTDIFSLGQLLLALGCGLDLSRTSDVASLIDARGNLYRLDPELHPVIVSVAAQMVEPDRHRRAQDLHSLIEQLENYRDQPLDFDVEAIVQGAADRRTAVLGALRDRLFDLSRRNRLINFRPTAQTLNLTEVSVPLMLDVRTIRSEQLFTWRDDIAEHLLKKAQPLGKWIRYDEAPYAANTLDKLISTARRDRADYGQDQLRLVPAFLRWHDLKNDRDTRLASPLVLAKVELTRKRGVRDSYTLRVTDPIAEVNPTLRHSLRQLYGISLPENVDLSAPGALRELHERLAKEIQATEPGLQLHLREKPRIDLVRQRAMTRLRTYNRRRHGNVATGFGGKQYPYSYRRTDYQPLGVQIFRAQIAQQSLPLGIALGAEPRRPGALETDVYSLDTEGGPYSWDVDLCAVSLANFNYRTLGLVRDYDELLTTGESAASFDQLFSDRPRPVGSALPELPPADRHLVVPADGSQVAAIARARRGESFVIQGPPGTGKSQTITNLIADFVARGKRVLFVCQKRAALDVVHARLASRRLDGLCALIHDSQGDKKAFIHGLRETYESWLSGEDDLDALTERRAELVARVDRLLATVDAFEKQLATGSPRLRDLVNRLAALQDHAWNPPEGSELPAVEEWFAAEGAVREVAQTLAAADPSTGGVLARSPLAFLARWDSDVTEAARELRAKWDAVAAALVDVPLGESTRPETAVEHATVRDVRALARLGRLVEPLAALDQVEAIVPRSATARELSAAGAERKQLVAAQRAAWKEAAGWQEPLAPADARSALKVAQSKEGGVFSFLSGDWRRVKNLVRSRFDSTARSVQPSVTEILTDLVAAQSASAAVAEHTEQTRHDWAADDPRELIDQLAAARKSIPDWRFVLDDGAPAELARLADALDDASEVTSDLLADHWDTLTVDGLSDLADRLASQGPVVRAVGPNLRELPPSALTALRRLDATPDQLEYAVCAAEWDRARSAAPLQLSSDRVDAIVGELSMVYDDLTALNAEVVVAQVRRRFLAEVDHSERSVTGMSPEDRERKKTFATGRRELEHEFGKVMRYRSIRDVASGAPGAVVSVLRPVWLMSPSSVSDTLPLTTSFDVVVYDEASQIPVEEAIPALHRAPQLIVVGDQMQLPPTTYFRVRSETDDLQADDEAAEQVGIALTEDSFLSISALRLASTMLTWHYRSRSEALISFSNAAFYQGKLATVPDRLPPNTAPPWTLRADSPVSEVCDSVLAGSITAVRLVDGVYVRRTNPAEARWIASLVQELLTRGTGKSLGIVAFSEAQQGEIERALDELAERDPSFAALYEAEQVRTHGEQDAGLFVKNLENVQGDERDIILMSVCYAAGPDGRMLMNFGPINTSGGEKRLNVIFSRAREHMVIVSSIEPDAITNSYNDGANTLRRFLGYAAAVSRGDQVAAKSALASYNLRTTRAAGTRPTPVVEQLAAALEARGVEVDLAVGESVFRCDLALKVPGDTGYRLAVLVDTPDRVAADTLLERLTTHPTALSTTGWRVHHVLTTDWTRSPETVVSQLVDALHRPVD
ncbi:AAA domain-containing protein [Kribbella sp. VKM Ac-2571]|uniref:AAA domain-containing protein n=1 Tax=Kribbella sp. VKM Ac-2571 TaxID=2512222 RepID=UPI00105CB5AB|nr:AAA domain-containing protein [Kribbella sp. VKM Ac-2571]TDO62685.1 AAA domain-containing protein [Kribbella sp. VKM Ac-2571]